MSINENTSINDLLEIAKNTLQELNNNEVFIVKDLFRGFEWNRIPKGIRTKLGGLFFIYAQNEGSSIIKPLGKTPQNQQQYMKV